MEKIKEKIKKDLILAVKEKKEIDSSVLRMLLSNILLKEKDKSYKMKKEGIEGETELREEEIINVIISEAKKRKDSIVLFKKGNRDDLVKKEEKELSILSDYLPEQISKEELKKIIKEAINRGKNNIKEIMAEVMPKVKGRSDGSIVSSVVKEVLDGI